MDEGSLLVEMPTSLKNEVSTRAARALFPSSAAARASRGSQTLEKNARAALRSRSLSRSGRALPRQRPRAVQPALQERRAAAALARHVAAQARLLRPRRADGVRGRRGIRPNTTNMNIRIRRIILIIPN